MRQPPYLFNQLCSLLDRGYFDYLVKKHSGNRYVKTYTCWNHLLTMLWAQLTGRKSLRDIEFSLRGLSGKLYQLGIGRSISHSTISEANATRDVAIYRGIAERMMEKAARAGIVKAELADLFGGLAVAGLYAVDSSTVHLDLSRYPWSVPQRNGGGIRLHTMLDILREIPVTCLVTGNEERDQTFMDDYRYAPHCLYLFDKAYVKAKSLFRIHKAGAYFIVRPKGNMRFDTIRSKDTANAEDCRVLADLTVTFSSAPSRRAYPEELRLVHYYSPEKKETISFLTNHNGLPADVVAYAYKNRWAIEVFFKWLKQNLRIEDFFGRSANAVSIQVYTAVTAQCLIALFSDRHGASCSNYELTRALSLSLAERRLAADWIQELREAADPRLPEPDEELNLFNWQNVSSDQLNLPGNGVKQQC